MKFMIKSTSIHRHLTRERTRQRGRLGKQAINWVDAHDSGFVEDQTILALEGIRDSRRKVDRFDLK